MSAELELSGRDEVVDVSEVVIIKREQVYHQLYGTSSCIHRYSASSITACQLHSY